MNNSVLKAKRRVLLIYTGGTIGMIRNRETGALESFNFDHLMGHVPELREFDYHIESYLFDPPIDSSDMQPELWARLVTIVSDNYQRFDGFVILHGTDTMAYTASALSFMLENLDKPVVLTGSQLPIGVLRTDGKENLINAIELAAACDEQGRAMVPEVCVCFGQRLYRGNRVTKCNAENSEDQHHDADNRTHDPGVLQLLVPVLGGVIQKIFAVVVKLQHNCLLI